MIDDYVCIGGPEHAAAHESDKPRHPQHRGCAAVLLPAASTQGRQVGRL